MADSFLTNPSLLSKRVKEFLKLNLSTPSNSQQDFILGQLRKLNMDEILQVYHELISRKIINPPYIEDDYITGKNYKESRKERNEYYISSITQLASSFINELPHGSKFCDIGCGTGLITIGVLEKYIKNGGKAFGFDLLNYISPEVSKKMEFVEGDALVSLKKLPENFFDGIMETAVLHHLESKEMYKKYLKEMIRVTKKGGLIIILETTHTNWTQHFKNAILDVVSNDTTSRVTWKDKERKIPVPLQFLSDKEITDLLKKDNVDLIKKLELKTTVFAPQFHILYICRKQ